MKDANQIKSGCIFAITAQMVFGMSCVFTKSATEVASTYDFLAWKFFASFLIMTILILTGIVKIHLKGKNLRPLIMLSLFGTLIYSFMKTIGTDLTTSEESSIFFSCIPVAALLASTLLLKKKPSKAQIVGIAITILGVTLTVVAGLSVSLSALGYACLIIAVIAQGLGYVYAEKASQFTPSEIAYFTVLVGTIVFGTIALAQNAAAGTLADFVALPIESSSFLIAILYLGIGTAVIGEILATLAVKKIGSNKASSFIGLSTIVGIIAGAVFLNESLSAWQILGAIVILIGVYIANAHLNFHILSCFPLLDKISISIDLQ